MTHRHLHIHLAKPDAGLGQLILAALQRIETKMSALDDASAELKADVERVLADQAAKIKAAVAAELQAQAADDATVTATLKALDAEVNAFDPATPASLTVTPNSGTIPVGSTTAFPVAVTGGSGAISASGLPAGVTYDGTANLVPDGSQVAGDSTVTFTDSATPTALTGSFSLTVA